MQVLLDHIRAVRHVMCLSTAKKNLMNYWTIWMSMRGSIFQISEFNSQCLRANAPNHTDSFWRTPAGTSAYKLWCKGIFLILGFLLISADLYAQTPTFDQLKERFESGEVFAADFQHIYTDSYTEESTSSSGDIWIDQVRYKLESQGQTIVVDGETSRVYDANRNRVIIDTYEPENDDFAPSRMLSGIDTTYTVTEQKQGLNFVPLK